MTSILTPKPVDDVAGLSASDERAAICYALGCVDEPGVPLRFVENLKRQYSDQIARTSDVIRMWEPATPTERQELDRFRRGWGPSSPTERMKRREDVLTAWRALSSAMDYLDEAYAEISKVYAALDVVRQQIRDDPAEWPDIKAAEERGAAAALSAYGQSVEATTLDPWVDTRIVRFDDTILFGHGGFDFDAWESLRWEMHVPGAGSYAVWPNGDHGERKRWSFYGGQDGVLALDRYATEAEARSEAEAYALSIKTAGNMVATILRRQIDERDTEVAQARAEADRWRKLTEVPDDVRALSAAATQGAITTPPMITDLRIDRYTVAMTNPSGVGQGKADRDFLAAAWNRLRAQIAATATPPQQRAAETGERS